MNTNHNEKTAMEENRTGIAPTMPEGRLKQEINILRLEGSLFCFDPKQAKQRNGKVTLADARKKPVTVEIHPTMDNHRFSRTKSSRRSSSRLLRTDAP
jgi:hypothetical protein